MNFRKALTTLIVLALLAVWFTPASAQLGTTDVSTFTIQNIDTSAATVTVLFYKEGTTTPLQPALNAGMTNPFTLQPNQSFEVNVSQITTLPSGRYSVVIGSTAKVIAIGSIGGRGTRAFSGNYVGFSQGANPYYLSNVVYNYYGWYSLISVQNLGTQATNITVTMKCSNNGLTGTMTANNVAPMASYTFILRPGLSGVVTPNGFSHASTICSGSGTITSSNGQPLVATDTQTVAADGRTQAFNGIPSGAQTLYVPALYYDFSGWTSSLSIVKLSGGSTTVTVTYSNGGTNTCNLTDAAPDCLLYMGTTHPVRGLFSAKVTSNNGALLAGIANASKRSTGQAFTYNLATGGPATPNWSIPTVFRNYYNWNSSFTCQNIGSVDTRIRITYEGKAANAYQHPELLSAATNETIQIQQESEAFLTGSYRGSVTIEATTPGASISCITTGTNRANILTQPGDWTTSNNAFAK